MGILRILPIHFERPSVHIMEPFLIHGRALDTKPTIYCLDHMDLRLAKGRPSGPRTMMLIRPPSMPNVLSLDFCTSDSFASTPDRI